MELREAAGARVHRAVLKPEDDLRQDQIALGMLALFNSVWERHGVLHTPGGRGGGARESIPVEHPLYRVASCPEKGYRGWVEFLDDFTPVDKFEVRSKTGRGHLR